MTGERQPVEIGSLPPGVGLMVKGEAKYYTQRVTAPPMADCMFAALCTPLSFIGLDVPPSFVGDLREASGVPLHNDKGKPQGTTTAATKRAIRRLFGTVPGLRYGGLDDDDMLARLASREIAVRVVVSNQELPPRIRRWVGKKWDGLHAVAIGGARKADNGDWEVRWMDPAGRPNRYSGEFVPYRDVRPALQRTKDGKVRVTFGERDAAIGGKVPRVGAHAMVRATSMTARTRETQVRGGAPVRLLTGAVPGERTSLAKGTVFYHPETLRPSSRAKKGGDFRTAGRSLDRKWVGVWVNTDRVQGATGLTLLLVKRESLGDITTSETP